MIRMQIAFACLAFVLFSVSAEAAELFLCRNTLVREPVSLKMVSELRDKSAGFFRPGDRITAVFIFIPAEPEGVVEFKWERRTGSLRTEDRNYIHAFTQAEPGCEYVAYSWVIFDPSLLDKILGSKHEGEWAVNVLMNSRKVGEKRFIISRD